MGVLQFIESTLNIVHRNFDLKDLDSHESLAFIQKKYKVNPSDIAAAAITFLFTLVVFLEGFRLVVILGCYVFPLFHFLVKMALASEAQKNQRSSSHTDQQMKDHLRQRRKASLKEDMNEVAKRKEEESKSETLSVESQKNEVDEFTPLTTEAKVASSKREAPNTPQKLWELNQAMITFLLFNLAMDLFEPVAYVLITFIENCCIDLFGQLGFVIWEGEWIRLLSMLFILPKQAILTAIELEGGIHPHLVMSLAALRVFLAYVMLKEESKKAMLQWSRFIFMWEAKAPQASPKSKDD